MARTIEETIQQMMMLPGEMTTDGMTTVDFIARYVKDQLFHNKLSLSTASNTNNKTPKSEKVALLNSRTVPRRDTFLVFS